MGTREKGRHCFFPRGAYTSTVSWLKGEPGTLAEWPLALGLYVVVEFWAEVSQAQAMAPFLLPYPVLLLIHRSCLERNWGTLALLFHLFVPDIYDNKVALMGIFPVCLQWGWSQYRACSGL